MSNHREDLIAMGFAPERVDWALRATSPDADLQIGLDHILEHENQPVPAIDNAEAVAPTSIPTAFPAPDCPPPFVDNVSREQQQIPLPSGALPFTGPPAMFPAPDYPPPVEAIMPPQQQPSPPDPSHPVSSLANSIGQMSLHVPLIGAAGDPPSLPAALTFEDEAVQRYRDFLVGQRATISDVVPSKDIARATYGALMKFFSTESLRWSDRLQLSASEVASISSSNNIYTTETSISGTLSPLTDPLQYSTDQYDPHIPTEASTTAESDNNFSIEFAVQDPIPMYDPTRPLLPASESMAKLLTSLPTFYYEDEPVEALRKRVREYRPRLTDQISEMRWEATRSTDLGHGVSQQQSDLHYSSLSALRSRGDWDAANRLEEEYKQQTASMRQQENLRKHQEYCHIFLDPAREKIHATFRELHPLYAELQRILEADIWDLDVVRAVSALEEASDLMEQGMAELETMEDDRRDREFEMQGQVTTDDSRRSNPWGDASNLEKQKRMNDVEIRAAQGIQKSNRRNAFFALVLRRMEEAIAGVDRDKETLTLNIEGLIANIPDTLPLDQEDAWATSGNAAPSQIPLPSMALYNQIVAARSAILSIDKMGNDMREVLRSLQKKQVAEHRERDMAQLELMETRMGRGDIWHLGAGATMREKEEKEDEASERVFGQQKGERRTEMTRVSELISAASTRYRDREASILERLARRMTARDLIPSTCAVGDGNSNTTALVTMLQDVEQRQVQQMQSTLQAMEQQQEQQMQNMLIQQRMQIQQQQHQMFLDMMRSQAASFASLV